MNTESSPEELELGVSWPLGEYCSNGTERSKYSCLVNTIVRTALSKRVPPCIPHHLSSGYALLKASPSTGVPRSNTHGKQSSHRGGRTEGHLRQLMSQ